MKERFINIRHFINYRYFGHIKKYGKKPNYILMTKKQLNAFKQYVKMNNIFYKPFEQVCDFRIKGMKVIIKQEEIQS